MALVRRPAQFAMVGRLYKPLNGQANRMTPTAQPKSSRWAYSSSWRRCFVVGIGVNFPMAIQGSGRNQPSQTAGFDP
jgi:hypothetical protein